MITITRYHDISCGHRVAGHESKCAYLHGHNYRVHFTCAAERLDAVGRVIDFSAVKSAVCEWLEKHWDHRFLLWDSDHEARDCIHRVPTIHDLWARSIVWVPFNPTAENMAEHLLKVVGPAVLPPGVRLIKVTVDETRKCSASAEL